MVIGNGGISSTEMEAATSPFRETAEQNATTYYPKLDMSTSAGCSKRAVPDLAKNADGISQEVEATNNLVELPQKSADVVALKGVGELCTSGSDRIGLDRIGG